MDLSAAKAQKFFLSSLKQKLSYLNLDDVPNILKLSNALSLLIKTCPKKRTHTDSVDKGNKESSDSTSKSKNIKSSSCSNLTLAQTIEVLD